MKHYKPVLKESLEYPIDPKRNRDGSIHGTLLNKVKLNILWDKLNKKSSFYGGFFVKYKNNEYSSYEDNKEFYDKMFNLEFDKINKFGKKIGINSKTHPYSFTSRGGWVLYASKTLDRNAEAILLDFDPEFYNVKK